MCRQMSVHHFQRLHTSITPHARKQKTIFNFPVTIALSIMKIMFKQIIRFRSYMESVKGFLQHSQYFKKYIVYTQYIGHNLKSLDFLKFVREFGIWLFYEFYPTLSIPHIFQLIFKSLIYNLILGTTEKSRDKLYPHKYNGN